MFFVCLLLLLVVALSGRGVEGGGEYCFVAFVFSFNGSD